MLAAANRERAEIEQWLTSADAYTDENRERMQQSIWRQGRLAAEIDALESRWLEAQDELERIQ